LLLAISYLLLIFPPVQSGCSTLATLGEDVKKAAEEKFQQINNAKERIYKARGIK
jgi:predicted small secreted protein